MNIGWVCFCAFCMCRCSILLEWLCCVASLDTSHVKLAAHEQCLALRVQAVAAALFLMADEPFSIDEQYLTEASLRYVSFY